MIKLIGHKANDGENDEPGKYTGTAVSYGDKHWIPGCGEESNIRYKGLALKEHTITDTFTEWYMQWKEWGMYYIHFNVDV